MHSTNTTLTKTFFVFCFLIFSLSSSAQLTFQQQYNYGVTVKHLKQEGIVYSITDEPNNQILLFDENHQLWKTIDVPVPQSYTLNYTRSLSQHVFNTDDEIEYIFSSSFNDNGQTLYKRKLVTESGHELLDVSNYSKWEVTEDYLFLYQTPKIDIYKTSDYSLLNTIISSNLKAITLNSGEKIFYSYHENLKKLTLYDNDLNSIKTVTLPIPDGYEYEKFISFSQSIFNSDDSIEILFSITKKYEPWIRNNILINQSATVLKQINGLLDLVTINNQVYLKNFKDQKTSILSPIDFSSLQTLNEFLTPIQLDHNGQKFYSINQNTLNLYNTDFSPWKKIELLIPQDHFLNRIDFISDSHFNANNSLDVLYSTNNPQNIDYTIRMVSESGHQVFNQSHISNYKFHLHKGAPILLEALMNTTYVTNIYQAEGFHVATPEIESIPIEFYPNPAQDVLNIDMGSNEIKTLFLYDINGSLVKEIPHTISSQINVSNLKSGLYFLIGQTQSEKNIRQKVIIQ